jgi:hypothetical protein
LPSIYLVGFRGTGFRDKRYWKEDALIRAGHVGLYFEDQPMMILGFHPTEEASNAIGDDEAVIEWLKEHNTISGALQNDTAIFERAYHLANLGSRTVVWQMEISFSEADFQRIRSQAFEWFQQRTIFAYAFPPDEDVPSDERDNCATFPRKLGLPLPEPTGRLLEYIPAIEMQGEEWQPE